MFGKRLVQEFDIVDSHEDELIVVHNMDNPLESKIQGAYTINKFKQKDSCKLVSLQYIQSLHELGALKLNKQYEVWDLCYN